MLLEIPIRVDEEGSDELRNALEQCPTFQDRNQWENLKSNLSAQISYKLGDFINTNVAVTSILEVYKGFPQKIDSFLKALNRIESENNYYKKLYETIFTIAEKQQKKLENEFNIASNEIDNILNTNENIIPPDFENIWSDLCKILDNIDWLNIWNACDQLLNSSKKYDWRNEVNIKSFCFTKNYKLLKRVFVEENNSEILISFAQEISKSLNDSNESLKSNSKLSNTSRFNYEQETKEYDHPPILLIIVDHHSDDTWNVQAQFKFELRQEKIELNNHSIGSKCDDFSQIPLVIEEYIEYLNDQPKFTNIITKNLPIEDLRIEVFIPILNLEFNFDCWAKASENGFENYLVQSNKLFLRSRERYKGKKAGTCRNMLIRGWEQLEQFLQDESQSINRILLEEKIEETPTNSHELLIQKNDQVDNWTKLKNFMIKCNKLWGVRLQNTLAEDINERGRFFNAIFLSGIPLVCWQWESIPDDFISIEDYYQDYFCLENLSKRCHNLLEKTWELRSNAWGEPDEATRKQSPGYYLGMLLEDPEIMPVDADLKTAGGRQ